MYPSWNAYGGLGRLVSSVASLGSYHHVYVFTHIGLALGIVQAFTRRVSTHTECALYNRVVVMHEDEINWPSRWLVYSVSPPFPVFHTSDLGKLFEQYDSAELIGLVQCIPAISSISCIRPSDPGELLEQIHCTTLQNHLGTYSVFQLKCIWPTRKSCFLGGKPRAYHDVFTHIGLDLGFSLSLVMGVHSLHIYLRLTWCRITCNVGRREHPVVPPRIVSWKGGRWSFRYAD
jgi:hypothetical protein